MTTLSSAADVLRCLSADRPHLTVTTTAELLGVPKSTASRLLRAMQEAGLSRNHRRLEEIPARIAAL